MIKELLSSKYLKYILIAFLIYMPIFGNLGELPIRIWDESRLAINAIEMLNNGNFLVTYYDNQPDLWNTKPPLLIWCQVFFLKTIGLNELAIRLPSAIAALLTLFSLLIFLKEYTLNFRLGFLVMLVLLTTTGYIGFHGTRTGDYDSMLTLFTTTNCLFFFLFIETNKIKYLYFFFITIVLAVLTKSIAGLLFLPAFLIYIIYQKKFFFILKNKHIYFGTLFFLIMVLGYYLLIDYLNPTYIKHAIYNDIEGRFNSSLSWKYFNNWFYLNNMCNTNFKYWFFFVPFGLIISYFQTNLLIKKITAYSTILCSVHLLIISLSKSKLEWYCIPEYPFLAIIVGVGINSIFNFLNTLNWVKNKFYVLPFICIILLFSKPYYLVFNFANYPKKAYSYDEDYDKNFYTIGYYLQEAIKGNILLNNTSFIYDSYCPQNLFYIKILKNKGVNILFKDAKFLKNNEVVLSYKTSTEDYLITNYNLELIAKNGSINKYKVISKK